MEQKKEIKIEVQPDVASGHYSNFAVIAHGPNEFFIDFLAMVPGMPQGRVQSHRIVMTPENAKTLLMALAENVKKYESTFGEITRKTPMNGGGGEIPNPFIMGGKA